MMDMILKKVDKQLQTLRPRYYSCLLPPLTEAEIKALEEKYKLQLPQELITLYQWKNGQQQDCYEAFVNNSMFEPLELALETAKELTSMIGFDFEVDNWWNAGWVPVFHNGGGSYICYDTDVTFTGNKGQMIEYWNGDNDRNAIASGVSAFLAQLNKLSEETGIQDEFFTIEGEEGFPKIFFAE